MRTGPDLAFWTRLIPQLTHSMPCVKEAAAALGASYEHQMLRRRSSASKFSALKQITAAVKRLQDDVVLLPSGPVPVFVACVLLACAETIGHRNTDALLHLRGAFAAMSLQRPKGLIPWNDETSYTFQKFDIQIASYSSGGTPPMWQSDNIEDLQDLKSRPVTIETAEKALIRYLHTCYRFTSQAAEYRYRVKATQRSCLMMKQDRHIANLTSWLSWYRRGFPPNLECSDSNSLKGHVLQAQCLSALIWVSTILNPYETAYDQYAVQFQEIVEHVEQALAVNKGPSSLPIFTTGIGMIQPLWLTAINYRHSKWRSKAISLLRRCGREGPWCNYVEAASTEAFVRAEEGAYVASVRQASQTADMPFEILPEDLSEHDRLSGCSLLEVLEDSDGSKKAVVQLTKCKDMETLLANANPDDTSNWVIWYETCELTMRRTILIASLFSSISLAAAISPLDFFRTSPTSVSLSPAQPLQNQDPMNPGPVTPSRPDEQFSGGTGGGDGDLTISDILPQTRKINIFASLTRDVSTVTGRLESTKPSDNTTLLAPLNSAMQALPRKPWEDRPGDNTGISAQRNEDKAASNLQKFVEEHVVPTSPWKEGKQHKIKTLGGQDLWWEETDGKKVIMPGHLEVDGVVGRVGNGEIWAVKGVVNYA
ncbi:hypothetical protein LTS07_006995 [Exophiala sideris]|uniref:FAS1 domain-containing protein n=1 Tax=Exophiala sideris TaxID=1016849 RepID=A0ABR0J4K2_9EURO|nr:hypothetical protein LTS07_006995 [Exophiala sideris]KAK5056361.1 hypothetical protein LTR69_007902 [Exophiala sideris]